MNIVDNPVKNKIYEECIGELEKLVEALDIEFPRPVLIKHGNQLAYRHNPRVQSDLLASFLKIIRIVSLLNASLCLIGKVMHKKQIFCAEQLMKQLKIFLFLHWKLVKRGHQINK